MRLSASALCRGLGALALGGFLLVAFTPLAPALYARLVTPAATGRADAIVVLGASVDGRGSLSSFSLRRAVHGILLHRRGRAPWLVLLGTRGQGVSEAEQRARLAEELCVPPEAILPLEQGRTTREEAGRVAALLRTRGLRRVILVTGAQHMPRAAAVFRAAGIEVTPGSVDELGADAVGPEDRLRMLRHLGRELIARAYYRLAGFI